MAAAFHLSGNDLRPPLATEKLRLGRLLTGIDHRPSDLPDPSHPHIVNVLTAATPRSRKNLGIEAPSATEPNAPEAPTDPDPSIGIENTSLPKPPPPSPPK